MCVRITVAQASAPLLAKHGFVPSGFVENLDVGDPELVYFRAVS